MYEMAATLPPEPKKVPGGRVKLYSSTAMMGYFQHTHNYQKQLTKLIHVNVHVLTPANVSILRTSLDWSQMRAEFDSQSTKYLCTQSTSIYVHAVRGPVPMPRVTVVSAKGYCEKA